LYQNYPNPFNPITSIGFSIEKDGFVSLKVYDLLGNKIKTLVNENKTKGLYFVDFDGSELPSGIYFYVLYANNRTAIKKLILLK